MRPALLALLITTLAAACSDKLQEAYTVQIVGPIDRDDLANATTVVLSLSGREIAKGDVRPGQVLNLRGGDIDPRTTQSGVIQVRALAQDGSVVAFGQSPEVELALDSPRFRVFVQAPATLARSNDLAFPRAQHVAVSALAPPPAEVRAFPIPLVFFGLGRALVPDGTAQGSAVERFDDTFLVLDPLTQESGSIGLAGTAGGQPGTRIDAAALAGPDNTILVFGGLARRPGTNLEEPSAQLDLLRVRRVDFSGFQLETAGNSRTSINPGVARRSPAMAYAALAYAFGGLGASGPLNTIVRIDPSRGEANTLELLPVQMAAARAGHTATSVASDAPAVLIYGGAAAGGPTAELFVPSMMTMPLRTLENAGPARRDHAAVPLPDGRVLLVGGSGADGQPLASAVVFEPRGLTFNTNALTLATPRVQAVAFVVGNDLVVAGGRDATGAPIPNAEVFDARTLEPVKVIPALPRSRATASVLPNRSAYLIGGTGPNDALSVSVEVYQPRL